MKHRKPSKRFTKKRSRIFELFQWRRRSHKSNIIHEIIKKEAVNCIKKGEE